VLDICPFSCSCLGLLCVGCWASAACAARRAEVAGVQGDSPRVLFVRFFEGEGAFMDRATPPSFPSDRDRLKAALAGLVDIPVLMQTFPSAIRAAVAKSCD